jgi:hypothetical protein
MEVRNDVIGVLELDIDRHQRQHHSAETADGEQADERPAQNSIGVSKVIEPRQSVATQLKTFTPVGMAISIVAYMKNNCPPPACRW